ncbi:threonyl-tRNA synthetase [Acrasis kona]|uniref:threonine--tRNA ligase n=1 Tax=Acrasis kona TaxID=1008807 RepID=A0AAW2YQ13_9EUKA
MSVRNTTPLPSDDYFKSRLERFETYKQRRIQELGDQYGKPIEVTLPDGTVKPAEAYKTTPLNIAQSIAAGLANSAVVAKVNGKIWDMIRVIEESCTLEILKHDAPEAQEVFWHSSSHVLGEAMEHIYKCYLCKGPAGKDGFYYEAYMEKKTVSEDDYTALKTEVLKIAKEKQPFERLMITKDEALELFKENPFKVEILREKVPDGVMCSVYKCGDLIDPCKGPHLADTGRVRAFEVTKNSSTYWRASSDKESLQRIYGISFPDDKKLKEWQELIRQAKERDHRKIGKDQELWFFHPLSPGCVFMLPHGTRIFNTLIGLTRSEYRKRGFDEVQTPTLFHSNLWKMSGHWDKYQENLFTLSVDNGLHSLKPMNCPSHCLMFKNRVRSYKELPLRYADFGVLHRNELKGALSGMTRVRRFQQDDAHIFCTKDQIGQEMHRRTKLLIFGFNFTVNLSTRPETFLGDIEVWNDAEAQLSKALDEFIGPGKWGINPGDGAFYGPKIDIIVNDALKREFQCGTIQLDFQLPIRFDLEYVTELVTGTQQSEEEKEQQKAQKKKETEEKIKRQKEEGERKRLEKAQQKEKPSQPVKQEKTHSDASAVANSTPAANEEEEFVYEQPGALPTNYPKMQRPVIIHRAIYGSLERFMAIITEHYGGKWPFWLSPRQIMVVPIVNKVDEYASKVQQIFWDAGYYCDVDLSKDNFKKKLAKARNERYTFAIVVGVTESQNDTVNLKFADKDEAIGEMSIEECKSYFQKLKDEFK